MAFWKKNNHPGRETEYFNGLGGIRPTEHTEDTEVLLEFWSFDLLEGCPVTLPRVFGFRVFFWFQFALAEGMGKDRETRQGDLCPLGLIE